MKRRIFIARGSLTTLSLAINPFISQNLSTKPESLSGDQSNSHSGAQAESHFGTGPESQTGAAQKFILEELTISDLQNLMGSGKLTSVQITQLYLDRIQNLDKNGPKLNSIIEINPDALTIAGQKDKESREYIEHLKQKKEGLRPLGFMHGIPVLVKDNINTGDKMMTTAGSLALEGHYAQKDAFIIERLRAAGAIILGKTNLSEWANYRSTRSSSGWSSRGGQTKNPYVLFRTPSGSSAGSGCAVSANLCAIAIGTETDGSIVSPSSVSGIVGIKPTVGLLSRSGIIPISVSQDTAGPMARTVKDAAILLEVLTGVDENDQASQLSKGNAELSYTTNLKPGGLQGKKIGIEKSMLGLNEWVDALFLKAIALIKSQGAEVVDVELMKEFGTFSQFEGTVLSYEFKDGMNKYLTHSNCKLKTLKEIIDFNEKNADRVMPYFRQEIFIKAESRGDLSSKEYLQARDTLKLKSRKLIDSLLESHKLDAICSPTNGLAGLIDLINGDYDTGYSFSSPAAVSGYPHITVPMGRVHELPVGISFMGTAWSEASLISLAYAYEQASKHRVAPRFLQNSNPL